MHTVSQLSVYNRDWHHVELEMVYSTIFVLFVFYPEAGSAISKVRVRQSMDAPEAPW